MKVISFKQLPNRLPFMGSAVVYLLMDRFNAGGVAWGIVGTLMAILWGCSIWAVCKQESVEIKL